MSPQDLDTPTERFAAWQMIALSAAMIGRT
jgi:hypothetical protein